MLVSWVQLINIELWANSNPMQIVLGTRWPTSDYQTVQPGVFPHTSFKYDWLSHLALLFPTFYLDVAMCRSDYWPPSKRTMWSTNHCLLSWNRCWRLLFRCRCFFIHLFFFYVIKPLPLPAGISGNTLQINNLPWLLGLIDFSFKSSETQTQKKSYHPQHLKENKSICLKSWGFLQIKEGI